MYIIRSTIDEMEILNVVQFVGRCCEMLIDNLIGMSHPW